MRRLREALRMSGLRALGRGHRIDDGALALEHLVVEIGAGDLVLDLAHAGQHAQHAAPCRRSSPSGRAGRADRRGRRGPSASSAAILAALSASIVSAAFSTSETMSPMPRMRSAMRAGSKSSSASTFSPAPRSLIGLPVTARIESAAPPRPSPSTRVSTMPVMPRRSSKAWAVLTASWPVSASATSRISCGLASLHLGRLGHHRLVDRGAAGGVEDEDVVAAEAAGIHGAARDLHGAPGRRRSAGRRRRPGGRASRAAPWPPGGGCRARPAAPSSSGGRSGAWRSWRRSWSCRSPAGRPSGSRPAARRSRSIGLRPRRRACRPARHRRS